MADSKKETKEQEVSTPEVSDPNPTVGPTLASAAAVQASIDPLATRQALEKMRPKFKIITQGQFVPIRVDVPIFGMWVLNRVDEVATYRPKIALLPFVNQEYIDDLEAGALALLEVDSQCKVAVKLPPEVMETYREASVLRDNIREEALILVRRKLLPAGSLDAVPGDRGYRNTAVELMALGNLLRDHWSNIDGKSAITVEEVDLCSVLAQLLFRNADDRLERAAIPAQLSLLRQQAYTWLMLAYEELRRCLFFLESAETVEKLFPSLFQGRGGRKPAPGAEEQPALTGPVDSAVSQSPDAALEATIAEELAPRVNPEAPSVTDPVARAEAAQAASANTKASKTPFTS